MDLSKIHSDVAKKILEAKGKDDGRLAYYDPSQIACIGKTAEERRESRIAIGLHQEEIIAMIEEIESDDDYDVVSTDENFLYLVQESTAHLNMGDQDLFTIYGLDFEEAQQANKNGHPFSSRAVMVSMLNAIWDELNYMLDLVGRDQKDPIFGSRPQTPISRYFDWPYIDRYPDHSYDVLEDPPTSEL